MTSGELHDEAKAEIIDAAAYLESQRRGYDVRAWPIHGFSYSIVYTLEGDDVFIIAVRHHRRRPGYWRSRLR